MIELSTPLLPGLPSGMRPVGVSPGMTSDFALALAQITAPSGAPPAIDLPAPPSAMPTLSNSPSRQIAAVGGNILPVAIAFEGDAVPVDAAANAGATMASELLDLSPTVLVDTPPRSGSEIAPTILVEWSPPTGPMPAPEIAAPSLSKSVKVELVSTDGQTRVPPASVVTPDLQAVAEDVKPAPPRAPKIDAPVDAPVKGRAPKGAKPAPPPPSVEPAILSEVGGAVADTKTAVTEAKHDDAASPELAVSPMPPIEIVAPVPIEAVPTAFIGTNESNLGEKRAAVSVSQVAVPEAKPARAEQAFGASITQTPTAQAPIASSVPAAPDATAPRAQADPIVARGATDAVPLPHVMPITAGRRTNAATVAGPTTTRGAPAVPGASSAMPEPLRVINAVPAVPAVPADAMPLVAPVPAAVDLVQAAVPAASGNARSSTAPMPAPAPIVMPADAAAARPVAPVEPTPGGAADAGLASQPASALAPPAPSVGEALRAARGPSRAVADASTPADAAGRMPGGSGAPAVQPAAQAFAAAMFAAEPTPRSTARTRSTDSVEPLPIDSMLGAPAPAPHAAVQPTADTKGAPLDLTRQDWMASMIDRIETIRDDAGGRETRIRLAPDALGTIDLALRHDEHGELKVHIAAETPQARAILAEAAPRLTDMAEARGLKLGGSFVDAGTAGGDPRRDPQRPETQQPQRPASARGRETTTTDTNDERIA